MNRRAFLSTIAAGLTAAADPEKLLWVPGRKLISIPTPARTLPGLVPFVELPSPVRMLTMFGERLFAMTVDGLYEIGPRGTFEKISAAQHASAQADFDMLARHRTGR